jgi:hypothetical protein
MLADGISVATTKQDFGTSRWQLADKLNVRVRSLHRYPCCRKGSRAQSLGVMPGLVATGAMSANGSAPRRRESLVEEDSTQRVVD